jgi:hypothetical protein
LPLSRLEFCGHNFIKCCGSADPHPTFHFDADQEPDPTLNFTNIRKSDFFTLCNADPDPPK